MLRLARAVRGWRCPAGALARSTDRNKPMDIDAGQQRLLDGRQPPTTLSGGVIITQGTLDIRSNQAVIHSSGGDPVRAVLTGAPGHAQAGARRRQAHERGRQQGRLRPQERDRGVHRRRQHPAAQRLDRRRTRGLQHEDRPGAGRRPGCGPGQDPDPCPRTRREAADAGRPGVAQGLPFARSRQGFRPDPGCRRGRRPARPQRRRQDHLLLHDRRPGPGRCRPDRARRQGHHRRADVRPRQVRRRLPAAGTVGVPQAQRRRQHPPGAGTARGPRQGRARARTGQPDGRTAGRPTSPTRSAPACLAANAAASRSPARSRPSRG